MKDLILDMDSFLKQATISFMYLPFIVYYAASQKYSQNRELRDFVVAQLDIYLDSYIYKCQKF